MKTRLVDGVKVHPGSGNVFADPGLTQQEAAKRMGITQPEVSDMMRGDFTNLSERKLMDCLNRLG